MKVPLKAFWESVERRLNECSAEELRAILREMARSVPPAGRQDFLAQLGAGAVSTPTSRVPWENLLDDIEDLRAEIRQAMASADEWEERYGWQEEYYEEDSLGPYADFVEPATLLFERAALAFDYGEIALARQAYHNLFDLLREEDDYGRGVYLSDLTDVDVQEAIARYLRAVYETEPPGNRPRVLYEEMSRFSPHPLKLARLEDLIEISPRPFPDRETFLSDWIAFLRTQHGPNADAWLREAVRLSQGTAGLEQLARTEGRKRPRAYLDWFTALEREGKYPQVLTAAREALQSLPPNLPIRAAIADHLCIAAERLNDPKSIGEGRWEAFSAKPTFSRLLDLWEAFPAGDERTSWMQRAVEVIEKMRSRRSPPSFFYPDRDELEQPAEPDDALLAHAQLLAGELEAAHRAVAPKQVLGWSSTSSDQGLVVSFLLVLLSGSPPETLPPNLAILWLWSLQATVEEYGAAKEENLSGRAAQIYAQHIAWGRESGRLTLDAKQEKKYLDWCLKVARRRVEAIVGGQHRGSYNKAAVLTVACAEVLRLRGEERAAEAWIQEIRERFPRHSSFQKELRDAIQEE